MGQQGETMLWVVAFVVLQLMALAAADDTPSGHQSNCDIRGGGVRDSTGRASFYTEYVPSACYGDDTSPFPPNNFIAAGGDSENANIWNNGNNCGKDFTIQCEGNGCTGGGPITVKIVDHCPNGCEGGRAFDLSFQAFSAIADPNVGVITVRYSAASMDAWADHELIARVGHSGHT